MKKDAIRKDFLQKLSCVISTSSSPVVFCKRDAFENFAKFTENPLLDSLLNKVDQGS